MIYIIHVLSKLNDAKQMKLWKQLLMLPLIPLKVNIKNRIGMVVRALVPPLGYYYIFVFDILLKLPLDYSLHDLVISSIPASWQGSVLIPLSVKIKNH